MKALAHTLTCFRLNPPHLASVLLGNLRLRRYPLACKIIIREFTLNALLLGSMQLLEADFVVLFYKLSALNGTLKGRAHLLSARICYYPQVSFLN